MPISKQQSNAIKTRIEDSLRNRFNTYNPEPAVMPFHTRLLGKDRLALYSFIHSLNTNFGTTIFEPVAAILAKNTFKVVETRKKLETGISSQAQVRIQEIMDNLSNASSQPNKQKEIASIQEVCNSDPIKFPKPTMVDLYLENTKGEIYLIDIKTAKPNRGSFKEYKRTLLEWAANILLKNPKAKVNTLIAIPYNPYAPKPYERWTMRGVLDLDKELKVAEEFWDFLYGEKVYDDLLNCFESVGIKMRQEIDDYFKKFEK